MYTPEQMATLRDNGFTSDKRSGDLLDRLNTYVVPLVAIVEHRDNYARIEKNWFQSRPKSSKCFLLKLRSPIPDENSPVPMIRGRLRGG